MIDQQPVTQGVLDEVLVAVLALIGLLALVVVVSRIRIRRNAVRTLERLAPLRPDLLAVAAGEDEQGDARRRLAGDRSAGPALDRAVVDLLTKVRGAPADALVTVLRERNGVARALDSLEARSSVRRARATRTLGLLRDPAQVTDLVRMLDDRSGEVRIVAARAVGALGPRAGASAASAVLRAVRSRRSAPGVPATVAMGTLTQLGVEAEAAVAVGLEDADPGVRNVAAAVAGHSLFLSCAPRLAILAATDPDRTVRVSATEALGTVGRPGDVRAIARLLAPDEPASVRGAAARALGEMGGIHAVEALLEVLADDDRFLAVTAANALAQSGDGRGALVLAAADPDTPESARSAVTGVLQVLELRDATRGAG
ncbi:phycocyanin alpha phycocyanobilin lyase related protein NblB-like [Janibacter sp. HTCC2649]|nr:phycocyanin alpha phycocyanobilin lyase related protein NblB-like [Janibacter sp. HTCC2649]